MTEEITNKLFFDLYLVNYDTDFIDPRHMFTLTRIGSQ